MPRWDQFCSATRSPATETFETLLTADIVILAKACQLRLNHLPVLLFGIGPQVIPSQLTQLRRNYLPDPLMSSHGWVHVINKKLRVCNPVRMASTVRIA